MSTVTVEEAQTKLSELIEGLTPGEEIVITRNERPIARLIGESPPARRPRQPGSARDKILYMAEDFDAPLDDFKEYME
jgi:antitoxin (DNA-binding transcriptional repressor) of toxin-antitoxin stability system